MIRRRDGLTVSIERAPLGARVRVACKCGQAIEWYVTPEEMHTGVHPLTVWRAIVQTCVNHMRAFGGGTVKAIGTWRPVEEVSDAAPIDRARERNQRRELWSN